MSSSFFKRDVPLIIIITFALPMLLSRYVNDPTLTAINNELGFWSSIISMIAWGLGVMYLFLGEYHSTKKNPSLTQYVGFAVLCGFSVLLVVMAVVLPNNIMNDQYLWVYYGFYRAQSTAFYGLMFLYLGSASYRMLRARSIESTILLVAGLLYIFRNSSIFTLYFPPIMDIGDWIMNFPNRAATMAATMSMAFGTILIAARQLLGRERTAIEVA